MVGRTLVLGEYSKRKGRWMRKTELEFERE